MDEFLLSLVRCPTSGQKLRPASDQELERLNQLLAASADSVSPVQAALITDDGSTAYRVIDGIPDLISGEAIPLS